MYLIVDIARKKVMAAEQEDPATIGADNQTQNTRAAQEAALAAMALGEDAQEPREEVAPESERPSEGLEDDVIADPAAVQTAAVVGGGRQVWVKQTAAGPAIMRLAVPVLVGTGVMLILLAGLLVWMNSAGMLKTAPESNEFLSNLLYGRLRIYLILIGFPLGGLLLAGALLIRRQFRRI